MVLDCKLLHIYGESAGIFAYSSGLGFANSHTTPLNSKYFPLHNPHIRIFHSLRFPLHSPTCSRNQVMDLGRKTFINTPGNSDQSSQGLPLKHIMADPFFDVINHGIFFLTYSPIVL